MENNELDLADASESGDQGASQHADAFAAEASDAVSAAGEGLEGTELLEDPTVATAARKRRRGSRGGRNRKKPRPAGEAGADGDEEDVDDFDDDEFADGEADAADLVAPESDSPVKKATPRRRTAQIVEIDVELPDRLSENRASPEAAEKALVRRPQIGDTRPSSVAPATAPPGPANGQPSAKNPPRVKTPKAGGQRSNANGNGGSKFVDAGDDDRDGESEAAKKKRRRGGKGRGAGGGSGQGGRSDVPLELDADVLERRRGRERNGRPVGRYLMCVQVRPTLTQVAVLEGRTLIEHYVSRPADDVSQIHGNIYVGKVQNVLPGMEAAFVDISTPSQQIPEQ